MKNLLIVLIYLGVIGIFIACGFAAFGGFNTPNESAPFEIHSVEYLSDTTAVTGGRATVVTTTTGAKHVFEGWIDVPAKGTICVVVYLPRHKLLKVI